MKISIKNNVSNENSEVVDFFIDVEECKKPIYSIVHFKSESTSELDLVIKFTLNKEETNLTSYNFYYMEKVNLIFYRLIDQWGIIDWKSKKIKKKVFSDLIDFPFFYLYEKCILVVDDLFAETIDFKGNTIDEIGNEQPYEIVEHEDYFEFDIIGVEKRILYKTTAPKIRK